MAKSNRLTETEFASACTLLPRMNALHKQAAYLIVVEGKGFTETAAELGLPSRQIAYNDAARVLAAWARFQVAAESGMSEAVPRAPRGWRKAVIIVPDETMQEISQLIAGFEGAVCAIANPRAVSAKKNTKK